MIPTPFTLYRAARKLEGGHRLRIDRGGVSVKRYWNMRYPAGKMTERAEMEEGMRRLMRASVERRITHRTASMGEVGSFLSGGTDSSLVAGMVSQLRPGEARTFSIGFRETGYDEMEYARIAAKAFATRADEFYVSQEDIVASLPAITRAYGEPFANSSAVPTYFCALRARAAGCRFILGGDGGDEIFGGNSRYVQNYQNFRRFPGWFESVLGKGLALTPAFAKQGPLRKADNYLRRQRAPLHERIHAYDLSYYIPDLGRIFAPEFLEGWAPLETPQATAKRILDQADAADELDRYLYFDLKSAIMDNDLRKVNTMTELAGVEARYPFLDLDLVEFTGRIPVDLKVHDGKLRYLYKETFKDILPDAIVNKKKHGFGLPVVRWMLRDGAPLHDWLRDILFDGKLKARGIFRPEFPEDLYKRARADKTPYFGTYLYYIFALELWMREHERATDARTQTATPAGAGRDRHG
jgi:asparagine synthase (glutamine-hydrolysing)